MKPQYLFGLPVMISLTACSTSQQAAVEAAISQNAQRVKNACTVTLALANAPGVDLLGVVVPVVAQVAAAVRTGCGTASGLASLAQSASSVDWLSSVDQIMISGGAVLPAPVAPIPIGGDAIERPS